MKSEFYTEIYKVLLIRKSNLNLNRQICANGKTFLLNIF